MSIANFIRQEVFEPRLKKASVLAVYDPDRRYHDLCQTLADPDTALVDASESSITAREAAMLTLARLGRPDQPKKLLVYIPTKPPVTDEERQKDPYAVYSACGAVFPDGDGDGFMSLCLRAKPDHDAEIRRLFAENPSPSFALIDNIGGGLSWPTLRTALGAESAREILLALLVPNAKQTESLNAHESWVPEAKALLAKAMGLKLMTKGKKHSSVADELWRFLLFSEFAFDLPAGLPPALSNVPRASADARLLIEDICDTLRGAIASRSEYIARAETVESELELPRLCADLNDLGLRDTFPFEERTCLAEAVKALCAEDIDCAKRIVGRHGTSVWIGKGENQAQWGLVETALRLAEACDDAERHLAENARSLEALFGFYITAMQDVDRVQREFEQAVGDYIPSDNALTGAVDHARKRYAKLVEKVQAVFTKHMEATGWPAPGRMSNAEVFDKLVEPALKESGRRVAYIMVDALRYELGVTLHRQLADIEQADIRAACALLPTVTPIGMASLLPGAAAGLRLVKGGEGFSVALDGAKLASVSNRMEVLRARYGDRFAEAQLDAFVRSKNKLAPTVELLVLRSVDIDAHLENTPTGTLTTLNLIHQSLRSIRIAVNKLKSEGFSDVVIATDHGFVLNAHAEAGDLCVKPAGDWLVVHDRALLGEGEGDTGNFVLSAEKAGVRGDFGKLGGPRSMAPYRRGLLYFHGGASLQEAVVPVITIKLKQARQPQIAAAKVTLAYKNGAKRVTTRLPVVDLSVEGENMFSLGETFEILLEAYGKKGEIIGEAKRGGCVDGATGTVTLKPGEKVQVTIKMAMEFEGKFTLKALNPVTLSQYAAIDLETDYAV
ncbi:PglZ domain-containing protein [Rhodoblastus sp. 17X3]|uniref:PglZ domain-containing protein n=1 Tax=Rhodoblastus sp. 17X3 TaxID=3047026 RepID=UPI0024B655F5|nr:PglZ domain-containing protein [Rhodoblastus sp. 17X3]MDI9846728.1 PglZ domain-containing protein [Rhodoblastus sp. 17X3]